MALAQNAANPLPADGLAPVRESRAAVLASGERITVLGRWVVLAAAVILNHFGNRNAQDSLFTIDLILCFWALVNAGVSFLLLRGFRPGRWFGFLTTAVDLGVATSVLYYAGGYAAPTDFSLLFYLLIGGITRFATATPPAGFVMGRVFLFVFTALVAGLLVGDLKARLDLAVQAAVERAGQLEETKRREALEKERVERLQEVDKVRAPCRPPGVVRPALSRVLPGASFLPTGPLAPPPPARPGRG